MVIFVFLYILMKETASTIIFPTKTKKYGKLGKQIKISPKTNVSVCEPGYKIEFHDPMVEILIGIGYDEVAYLIMTESAYEAIKMGEAIFTTTTKEFIKQIER